MGKNKFSQRQITATNANEQIVVAVEVTTSTYDLDVISCAEYNAYVGNKNCIGRPLY